MRKIIIKDSHAQRDADGGEYTTDELASPSHPYRRLFAEFAEGLVIVADKDAGALARFGPA
jgi:hypothetical protein